MEIANYSDNVSSFKRDICTSSQKLLSQHIENNEMQSTDIDQIEQITLWAKRNNIKNIVTLACQCGHTRDFIIILKKELKKESIELI